MTKGLGAAGWGVVEVVLAKMKESCSGEGNVGVGNGNIMVTWMDSKEPTVLEKSFSAKLKAEGETIFVKCLCFPVGGKRPGGLSSSLWALIQWFFSSQGQDSAYFLAAFLHS